MGERSRAAFSLPELLALLGIVGVLVWTAAPNLSGLLAPWALDGGAKRIAAEMRLARSRAIARNTRYRVTFREPRSYWRERETAPGQFEIEGGERELPAMAQLGTVDPRAPVFDSRGMVPSTVRVAVSVAGRGQRTVVVSALGRTTIK
jgi:Tfp pilus assembly protein FimT